MKTPSALFLAALAASSTMALDREMYGIDYDTRPSQWGGCKDDATFHADFKVIRQLTKAIRVYTTENDCIDRLLNVAAAEDLRVWLGLWSNIDPSLDSYAKEFKVLQRLVKQHRVRNDNVMGIHVASEAMFRWYSEGPHDWANTTGSDQLIANLNETRNFLRDNGLVFPVTIADVVDTYKSLPKLFDVVDVVSVNQFSQWEGVSGADGVNVLFNRLQDVQQRAKAAGKIVLISETGWSAAGNVSAIKEASPASQARYLRDFMRYTEQQNIAYYYFTSFQLKWGNDTDFGVVEQNFGIFDVNRKMNPAVANITLGKYHKPTRLWNNGQVLKADESGALSLGEPADGLSNSLDHEIWFYDEELLTFRSRANNQCLDTYADAQGSHLHVYWCDGSNYNQKWRFKPDGTFQTVSYATPTFSDVTPDAAIAGKGVNVSDSNVTVPVGSFFASSKSSHGKCLTAQGNSVAMIDCKYDDATKWSVRPLDTEDIVIRSLDTNLKITEDYGRVTATAQDSTDVRPDGQIWYYDPLLQRIRNKANGRTCLDLVENQANGLVQGRWCDHTHSQSWSYNDQTGQIQNLGKLGQCIYADQANAELRVAFCDVKARNQKWVLELQNPPAAAYGAFSLNAAAPAPCHH
ncbi:Aste57867_8921 [Aphanomyces stellatus]|uniref:glucan endo-1,3-beta-D-glucosidase n=1 Tax=Aphanomyces stellatus TaxID=120398 RepID=A0A485KLG3_9STRA|nr:hypothetical protein As57867_008886 [Aphanomyces stellatus]VFT85805.1 Aste57867_8921 [Aphanomyces stellatus]